MQVVVTPSFPSARPAASNPRVESSSDLVLPPCLAVPLHQSVLATNHLLNGHNRVFQSSLVTPSNAMDPNMIPPNGSPTNNEINDQSGSSPQPRTGEAPCLSMILTVRLLMQGKEVGSIIGKRGDHIKLIRDVSAAKINISDGSCPERIVTITGNTDTIHKAFSMICRKFEEDMQQLPNSVPKPPITMRLIVPATQCGSLIGKGGSKIKEIREATGASIQVASEMLPSSTERAVTISGSADSIILCMQQICQILLEAPPKGATIPYRPKPSFNPLLVASSAAAAAAAAAAQQQAMLQSAAIPMPQFGQLAPAELTRVHPFAGNQFLQGIPGMNAAVLGGSPGYGPTCTLAGLMPYQQMTAQQPTIMSAADLGTFAPAPQQMSTGTKTTEVRTINGSTAPSGTDNVKQANDHAAFAAAMGQQYLAVNTSMGTSSPLTMTRSPPMTHPAVFTPNIPMMGLPFLFSGVNGPQTISLPPAAAKFAAEHTSSKRFSPY